MHGANMKMTVFYVHIDIFKKFKILYLDILQKPFIVISVCKT
jgi:hypothetical protein